MRGTSPKFPSSKVEAVEAPAAKKRGRSSAATYSDAVLAAMNGECASRTTGKLRRDADVEGCVAQGPPRMRGTQLRVDLNLEGAGRSECREEVKKKLREEGLLLFRGCLKGMLPGLPGNAYNGTQVMFVGEGLEFITMKRSHIEQSRSK